jgi:hypothetical protein
MAIVMKTPSGCVATAPEAAGNRHKPARGKKTLAKDGKVGKNRFTRHDFPRPLPVCTARLSGGFCYFWAISPSRWLKFTGRESPRINMHAAKKYPCKAFVLLVILLSTRSIEPLLS